MKILVLISGLNNGGAENYLLRFINHNGIKNKLDITIQSLSSGRGDLSEEFEKTGCSVIYKPIGYFNLKNFYNFYKFLKNQNFDSVCTFTGNFGGIPLTIARLAGVKKRIAWHRRSTDAFSRSFLKNSFNKFVNKLIRKNATSVLSNSRFALEYFYGNYYKNDPRFVVIPNGVSEDLLNTPLSKEEARKKLGLPLHDYLVGHVGRFDYSKNHETMFKVIRSIKKQNGNIKFLFCGKGTDYAEFDQKLKEYGIREICFNMGILDHVSEFYKSIDLFFFPSVTEGQPNALLEAMIADLPIIGSNIPPVLETLPEGQRENFLPPLDEEGFTKLILECAEKDPAQLEDFRYRNWALQTFNPDINFKKFLDIILE